MKILIFSITLILFQCLSIYSFAQINTYTFSQSLGSYTEIVGDSTIAFATGTSGPSSLDDIVYFLDSLPIKFIFNDTVKSFAISSNGFITFGKLTSPTNYAPISATTTYHGAVSGFGNDLIGTRGITGTRIAGSNLITGVATSQFVGLENGRIITGTGIASNTTITAFDAGSGIITLSANATLSGTSTLLAATGSITRGTTGANGSRIHTIQFRNFRNFTNSANSNCINFQIKLFETSNTIEIVYGINAASASVTGQVGLRGADNTDFNNRTTSTNWNSTAAGSTNSVTCSMTSTVLPPLGLTFRWAPPSSLTNNVGVLAIINPLSGVNTLTSTPIAPKATIKNFGTGNQTSPFNITCTINPGGYSSTMSDTLSSGLTHTIRFDSTFVPIVGTSYTVTVYTSLVTDINRLNDTLRHTSTFIFQNHGNDSGYFYANNLATNQPSFPNYIWKDTAGSKNLILNGTVASGTTLSGSLDDGYFKLSLKDILLSLGLDTNNKHFKYNGVCFDSVFPGTNGIIGFTENFGDISISEFQIDGDLVAGNSLLPLWKDFDLSAIGKGAASNRLSYKASSSELIITYDKVTAISPNTDWVSFQVLIEIVTGCGGSNSNFRYTYADTTTGQTSSSLVKNYLHSYDSIPNSSTTFRNFVIGYSLNGAPVPYAGYVSAGNPFPALPQTHLSVKRPAYNLTTKRGLAIEFGPNQNNLNEFEGAIGIVNITMAIEGFYDASNNRLNARDTVRVYLANNLSPFNFVDSSIAILDSVNLTSSFEFYNAPSESFFIVIKHRNSIETWSKLPQVYLSNGTLNYDFTSAQTQAYGNNMIQVDSSPLRFALFSGDVNQDGIIDASDLSLVDNDAFISLSGYVKSDFNGDNFVDASDLSIVDNNAGVLVRNPIVGDDLMKSKADKLMKIVNFFSK